MYSRHCRTMRSCETSYCVLRARIVFFCLGNKAYRDTKDGSWFVTGLIRILQEDAHKDDLLSMLTKVRTPYLLELFLAVFLITAHLPG